MTKQNKLPQSKGFKETIAQAQSHMAKPPQYFSRFIHIRVIDALSNVLSATLFRPIPLLCGALFALIIPSLLWLIAKYYGYGLSGSESIISFAFGWVIGGIIDYTKTLLTGKDISL